jgi:hypothetical protein
MNVEVFSGLTDSEMQWIIKFLERANRFDDNKWHLPEREYAVLQILFDEKEKTLRNEFIENRSPYDEANTLLDCMRGIFTTFHEIWGK